MHIYSVDTGAFYWRKERKLHWKIHQFKREKRAIEAKIKEVYKAAGDIIQDKQLTEMYIDNISQVGLYFRNCGVNYTIKTLNDLYSLSERYVELSYWKFYKTSRAAALKEELKNLLQISAEINAARTTNKRIRQLDTSVLIPKNVISVFESSLTRMLGIETDSLSEDIIVVKAYYYDVIKDIIVNGFEYNGEKYRFLTASAGQIRTKKTVFIKESLWNTYEKTLMCGLTIDSINERGGVNVNKFLAYLALSNSATDPWEDFDIDRCIVVPDFETTITGLVDHVDDVTYTVNRKEMDISIEHTDGCGMVLPSVNTKNFMFRGPWIKGLLAVFDFKKFIEVYNCNPVVTDIYGDKWNIIEDDIQIILTKSQFKMAKYYSSWQEYKDNFRQYHCSAGTCKEEEDYIRPAHINYQMLQTLTDLSASEINQIIAPAAEKLDNITSNVGVMLNVLGAEKGRKDMNDFQKSLLLYPELLEDNYSRDVLKDVKKSLVKKYRHGKLPVKGKYTFLVPDLYAFCQSLFLNIECPDGLLAEGEVSCRLYPRAKELDCLRAPHLSREHAVRRNVITQEIKDWFATDAIYTSSHDLISRILQFDK